MKAVMMVCNRSCTLRTTLGSIAFEKNVPRLVSPQMVDKALSIGVLPVDADEELFKQEAEVEPLDPGSRKAAIVRAIENIFARNDPDDFTTGASPKTKAVATESGLSKVSAQEIKDYLDKRNAKAFAADQAAKKAAREATKEPVAAAADNDPPDDDER